MANKKKYRLYRQWGDTPLASMGSFDHIAEAKDVAVEHYEHHNGTDRTGGSMYFYIVTPKCALVPFEVDYHITAQPMALDTVEEEDSQCDD